MVSKAFIDVILKPLSKVVKRTMPLTVYLDNATPHVSFMTKNWMRSRNTVYCMIVVNLSPRSPDVNITENVWAALEAAVAKMGIAKDLAQREEWLLKAAKTINFKHLYDTIRPRTAEVAAQHGKLLGSAWRKAENRRTNLHLKSLL